MARLSARELAGAVKTNKYKGFGFLGGLKFNWRVHICPFDEILPLIPEGVSLADIGCGSGLFVFLAAKTLSLDKILGLEISGQLVKECRAMARANGFGNLSAEEYDGSNPPPAARDFGVFTMIDVLHHIPRESRRSYLENLYRSIPPGGRLILKDIDADSPLVIFNKLHDLALTGRLPSEPSARGLVALCAEIGFSVVLFRRVRRLVYPHFIIVLEKR
ncbi:MAG: class I SAM-dependent methyltransferase [Clostridiales bacterium]|jgi:SAM-dependent methyltransferase|nr:class I SAM-dependent methyltransferase [Clostridiales bacterium]